MSESSKILRVGLVGSGAIAECHAKSIADSPLLKLAGVCGRDKAKVRRFAENHNAASFMGLEAMLETLRPDYVIICTPHPTHSGIALQCLQAGIGVLVEKPLSVTAADALPALQLARRCGLAFGVNFQMRLRPVRQRIRSLIAEGFLGKIISVSLKATTWFRSMAYYRSSPWRATWKGEGGGILMNQAPHDLDLLISLLGMPSAVCAEVANNGHSIEVEDEVLAMLRWPDGAMGDIHLSTRESPGRNFLEIAGTRGCLFMEGDEIVATALERDVNEWIFDSPEAMKHPPVAKRERIRLADHPDRYRLIHENFRCHLLHGVPLVCSAEEALQEVELANALLVSAVRRRWVETPAEPQEIAAVFDFLNHTPSLEAARRHFGG